jgi:hypothetical protein
LIVRPIHLLTEAQGGIAFAIAEKRRRLGVTIFVSAILALVGAIALKLLERFGLFMVKLALATEQVNTVHGNR